MENEIPKETSEKQVGLCKSVFTLLDEQRAEPQDRISLGISILVTEIVHLKLPFRAKFLDMVLDTIKEGILFGTKAEEERKVLAPAKEAGR